MIKVVIAWLAMYIVAPFADSVEFDFSNSNGPKNIHEFYYGKKDKKRYKKSKKREKDFLYTYERFGDYESYVDFSKF